MSLDYSDPSVCIFPAAVLHDHRARPNGDPRQRFRRGGGYLDEDGFWRNSTSEKWNAVADLKTHEVHVFDSEAARSAAGSMMSGLYVHFGTFH